MSRTLLLALLLTGGACDLEPDVGPPSQARCVDGDSDPDGRVSFALDVMPIFARDVVGCARCHDPGRAGAVGAQLSGLDLSSYDAALEGGARSTATLVVPGEPCDSVLYQKLLPGPPFGGRMPLDGPPYLSNRELQLIHDWIAEGALDN